MSPRIRATDVGLRPTQSMPRTASDRWTHLANRLQRSHEPTDLRSSHPHRLHSNRCRRFTRGGWKFAADEVVPVCNRAVCDSWIRLTFPHVSTALVDSAKPIARYDEGPWRSRSIPDTRVVHAFRAHRLRHGQLRIEISPTIKGGNDRPSASTHHFHRTHVWWHGRFESSAIYRRA